jgi:hypothetical protein
LNDGSSLKSKGTSSGRTAIHSLAGVGAVNYPVVGDYPGLNFTSIEQLDPKIREGCSHFLYKFGKCFSANPRIGVGVAKYAVFCESGDKRVSVATVPCIVIALCNLGSFHSRSLQSKVSTSSFSDKLSNSFCPVYWK